MANVQHAKRGALIGLKGLVFAKLVSDLSTGAVYETDLHLVPGMIEAGMTGSMSDEPLGADDNALYDMWSSLDSVDVNLSLAAIGTPLEAFLLGRTIDENGVMITGSTDEAPWVAMGFKSLRSDKSYDYIWLYKGKFKPFDVTMRSRERGTVNFQTPSIVGTFGPRDYDGNLMARVNDHDTGLATGLITTFLASVYSATGTAVEVSAAAFSVTDPVKAATPQATHASGTGYTAAIAWDPDDETFAAETEYTATVTLTAAAGYVFDPEFSASDVTGLPTSATLISVARTAPGTVVIEVVYPETAT